MLMVISKKNVVPKSYRCKTNSTENSSSYNDTKPALNFLLKLTKCNWLYQINYFMCTFFQCCILNMKSIRESVPTERDLCAAIIFFFYCVAIYSIIQNILGLSFQTL